MNLFTWGAYIQQVRVVNEILAFYPIQETAISNDIIFVFMYSMNLFTQRAYIQRVGDENRILAF